MEWICFYKRLLGFLLNYKFYNQRQIRNQWKIINWAKNMSIMGSAIKGMFLMIWAVARHRYWQAMGKTPIDRKGPCASRSTIWIALDKSSLLPQNQEIAVWHKRWWHSILEISKILHIPCHQTRQRKWAETRYSAVVVYMRAKPSIPRSSAAQSRKRMLPTSSSC